MFGALTSRHEIAQKRETVHKTGNPYHDKSGRFTSKEHAAAADALFGPNTASTAARRVNEMNATSYDEAARGEGIGAEYFKHSESYQGRSDKGSIRDFHDKLTHAGWEHASVPGSNGLSLTKNGHRIRFEPVNKTGKSVQWYFEPHNDQPVTPTFVKKRDTGAFGFRG